MHQQRAERSQIQPKQAEVPVELELGDGSRLVLEEASSSPLICRIEASDCERISLEDALGLAGEPFAGYRREGGVTSA